MCDLLIFRGNIMLKLDYNSPFLVCIFIFSCKPILGQDIETFAIKPTGD